MKIDDEKILEHYVSKRKTLMLELDALNAIIDSIEWNIMCFGKATEKDVAPKVPVSEQILLKPKDENIEYSEFQKKQFRRFKKYNSSFTYNEKVYFALTKAESATIHEMVEIIKMYDESLDEKKLYNGLTMAASTLNTSQEILSKKEGKRNRYFLKDEPNTIAFNLLADEGPF